MFIFMTVYLTIRYFLWFLFWLNYRFRCSWKKEYMDIPSALYPVSPSGNILRNYTAISQDIDIDSVKMKSSFITTRIPPVALL